VRIGTDLVSPNCASVGAAYVKHHLCCCCCRG
jgi:hypothetical protein